MQRRVVVVHEGVDGGSMLDEDFGNLCAVQARRYVERCLFLLWSSKWLDFVTFLRCQIYLLRCDLFHCTRKPKKTYFLFSLQTLALASTLAAFRRRILTTSGWLALAAKCSGVSPLTVAVLGLAPC